MEKKPMHSTTNSSTAKADSRAIKEEVSSDSERSIKEECEDIKPEVDEISEARIKAKLEASDDKLTVPILPDSNGEYRIHLSVASKTRFLKTYTEDLALDKFFGLSYKMTFCLCQMNGVSKKLYIDIRDQENAKYTCEKEKGTNKKKCNYKLPGIPCGCKKINFVFAGFCRICWADFMEGGTREKKTNDDEGIKLSDVLKANGKGVYVGEQGDTKRSQWPNHVRNRNGYGIIEHCEKFHKDVEEIWRV